MVPYAQNSHVQQDATKWDAVVQPGLDEVLPQLKDGGRLLLHFPDGGFRHERRIRDSHFFLQMDVHLRPRNALAAMFQRKHELRECWRFQPSD